ncbi:hypothetical protein SAMN05444352_107189 [Pseudomonas japonica]|uniref:Uncharacterized protein n=1 Tax=Pseudomonas japonica TaxID=256466 RepID=A0A239ECQ0_9PSED|nr:hypothetical protein SAMN05444352_107189 [Pseudomonas japonica]
MTDLYDAARAGAALASVTVARAIRPSNACKLKQWKEAVR